MIKTGVLALVAFLLGIQTVLASGTPLVVKGTTDGTANGDFTSGVAQVIKFDTREIDPYSALDITTNKGRFTVPTYETGSSTLHGLRPANWRAFPEVCMTG